MTTINSYDIDRGWAWVAAVCVYLSTIINCTNLYMRGVIYIALLEKYNEGQGKTSLVGALNSGCLCCLCEYEGSHIYSSSRKI